MSFVQTEGSCRGGAISMGVSKGSFDNIGSGRIYRLAI